MDNTSIANGQSFVIKAIEGAHADRLLCMGFIPGDSVTVVQRSPWNSPIFVEIRNTLVALRPEEFNCLIKV